MATIRILILFCGLAVLAATAHAADPPDHRHSVAVIIGNKAYRGRIPDVSYAHRDADAIKAYLTQVLGYREGNIIDLRDATQAELMSAFGNDRDHQGKLWRFVRTGRSHVTVFYSGHGVPGLKDGRGYLLPVDADPDTPEINGYPVDLLYENLGRLEARSVTVYLDACFSGESDQGMLIRSASPVFVQGSLLKTTADLTVLTAASANQVASWDEENRHGLFTWHLLQALQGAADTAPFGDGDGTATLAETRAYLDDEMTYAAQRRFGRIQNASVQGAEDALLGMVPDEPVQVAVGAFPAGPKPGESFKDCEVCPVMVIVPPGSFQMGSRADEKERRKDEGPQHEVSIAQAFAVGKYEVTTAEYAFFVADTGYSRGTSCFTFEGRDWAERSGRSWHDPGIRQSKRDPAVCVSWDDARAYTDWLSRRAGKSYRLLSEAEWEYAARAGTTTVRFWGDNSDLACSYANVNDMTGRSVNGLRENHVCDDGVAVTAAVGSFAANAFGLHDMLGNVWEWTADCWIPSYAGAPSDGSAQTGGDCEMRVLRGGAWNEPPMYVRSADRDRFAPYSRGSYFGFRVARALD